MQTRWSDGSGAMPGLCFIECKGMDQAKAVMAQMAVADADQSLAPDGELDRLDADRQPAVEGLTRG